MAAVIDTELPLAPTFVLRGHPADVQCIQFTSIFIHDVRTSILISGDADGFVLIWSLKEYRPIAIWQAHRASVLTVTKFQDYLVTHGRDNKLYVWDLDHLTQLSARLPISKDEAKSAATMRSKPEILNELDVNALNFCQFSSFCAPHSSEMLVAVPGLIGSEYIDVYALPSTARLATRIIADSPSQKQIGSVMCIDLKYPFLAAAYEDGSIALFRLDFSSVDRTTQKQDGKWTCLKTWSMHRDAALSVVLDITRCEIFSCGIDSFLYKYSFRKTQSGLVEVMHDAKSTNTKHSGQQCMRLRSDGKLLGTAGWDKSARIYSAKSLKQLAVLSSHKSGISSFAFQEKKDDTPGQVALGSKDGKISLWSVY